MACRGPGSQTQATSHAAGPSAGVSMLRVVLRLGCCRVHARYVGQVTDVCGAARQADRSRSIPVGYPGRRMIEHDCNPAARQAVYPVGEEHDPDPPAPQQGTGRDLTCQPCPGATATPGGLTGRALVLWRATAQQARRADAGQSSWVSLIRGQPGHGTLAAGRRIRRRGRKRSLTLDTDPRQRPEPDLRIPAQGALRSQPSRPATDPRRAPCRASAWP